MGWLELTIEALLIALEPKIGDHNVLTAAVVLSRRKNEGVEFGFYYGLRARKCRITRYDAGVNCLL